MIEQVTWDSIHRSVADGDEGLELTIKQYETVLKTLQEWIASPIYPDGSLKAPGYLARGTSQIKDVETILAYLYKLRPVTV